MYIYNDLFINSNTKKFKPKLVIEFSPKFYSWNEAKQILLFLKQYYSIVYVIKHEITILNLLKKKDIEYYYDLEKEKQVNLFFK